MLSPAEQAEITSLLHDRDRFHSDGEAVFWAAIIIPILCLLLIAFLYGEASSVRAQIRSGELPLSPSTILYSPELLSCVGLILLAIATAGYGIHTHGRHGVAITSFGVARLRGGVKTLIRYPDLDSTTFDERRYPVHRVITDELEVKAKDGRVIMLYGFNVARRKLLIESEWKRSNPAK